MPTVRIPLAGSPTNRGTSVSYDQRFVNCFPEIVSNPATGDNKVYVTKRNGTKYIAQPSGTTGEGRGFYSWNSKLYAVIENKLYSGRYISGTWTSNGTTTVSFSSTGHALSNTNVVDFVFNATFTDGRYAVANVAANSFDITHGSTVAAGSGTFTAFYLHQSLPLLQVQVLLDLQNTVQLMIILFFWMVQMDGISQQLIQ